MQDSLLAVKSTFRDRSAVFFLFLQIPHRFFHYPSVSILPFAQCPHSQRSCSRPPHSFKRIPISQGTIQNYFPVDGLLFIHARILEAVIWRVKSTRGRVKWGAKGCSRLRRRTKLNQWQLWEGLCRWKLSCSVLICLLFMSLWSFCNIIWDRVSVMASARGCSFRDFLSLGEFVCICELSNEDERSRGTL